MEPSPLREAGRSPQPRGQGGSALANPISETYRPGRANLLSESQLRFWVQDWRVSPTQLFFLQLRRVPGAVRPANE